MPLKSAATAKIRLQWWKARIGLLPLSRLTKTRVREQLDSKKAEGCTNATVNRQLAALRRVQQPTPITASTQTVEGLLSEWATFADMRGDFEKASRLCKWNIEVNPDFTISLYGLVKQLAKLGRFPEAERCLARLKASDPV